MTSEKTLRLVAKIYEAAGNPSAWNDFLRTFAEAGGGTMAALFRHDGTNQQYDVLAFHGVPDEYIRLYLQHYAEKDEWIKGGLGILETGWVGSSQTLCSDAKLLQTEFYSDFLRRYDLFHQCGGIVQQTATARSAITLLRPRRKGFFNESETTLLRTLMPHLQQAMKLHQQFVDLRAHSRSLETAIDSLAIGIIFLDDEGKVLLLNRKAEALIRQEDGLLLTDKRISASVPQDSSRLKAAVVAAANTGRGKGDSAGGTFLVSREKGRALSVTVAPLRDVGIGMRQQASAVLFISDPDRKAELPLDLLRRCYGLTFAEARLATVLVQGRSLKEAADLCGVTHNTAKSQLKCVFLKTEVKRQSELVRLLLNNAGVVHQRIEAS
jgi:DNA-binding CsgD family transcriptional regulator